MVVPLAMVSRESQTGDDGGREAASIDTRDSLDKGPYEVVDVLVNSICGDWEVVPTHGES